MKKNPFHIKQENISTTNLILFGYQSVGKTYYGKLVAKELRLTFIDTDQWVENLYTYLFQEKLSCREISMQIGEQGFRNLEKIIIEKMNEVTGCMIAVGGGSVLNCENRFILNKIGVPIYLELPKEVIKHRLFSRQFPSFLDPSHPDESFIKMYEERKPIYENFASYTVQISNKTDRQICDELITIRNNLNFVGNLINPNHPH